MLSDISQQLKQKPKGGDPPDPPPTPPDEPLPPPYAPLGTDSDNLNPAKPPTDSPAPEADLGIGKSPSIKGVHNPSRLPKLSSKNGTNKSKATLGGETDQIKESLSIDPDDSGSDGSSSDDDAIQEIQATEKSNDLTGQKRKKGFKETVEPVSKRAKTGGTGCYIDLEGVTLKHGKNSDITFVMRVSRNRDGSGHTQSISDDESDMETTQPEVTSTPFISDDDPTSQEVKKKVATPPPKKPPAKAGKKTKIKEKEENKKGEEEEEPDDSDEEKDNPGDSQKESNPDLEVLDPNEEVTVGKGDDPNLIEAHLQM